MNEREIKVSKKNKTVYVPYDIVELPKDIKELVDQKKYAVQYEII